MIFLLICLSTPSAFAFAGGDGSSSNPYQISTVNHLQDVGNNLSSHFILIDNIDASDTSGWSNGFDPIGDGSTGFSGSFDGQGYVIFDLYTNAQKDYIGLFGYIASGGTVKNVGLERVDVDVDDWWEDIGGLAGRVEGEISNCYTTGSVTSTYDYGDMDLGGLVGWLTDTGSISNSYSTCNVNGKNAAGGFVSTSYGTVSNSYSKGDVTGGSGNGTDSIGGFIGYLEGGSVSKCYSTCQVNNSGYTTGGLIGHHWSGTVNDSFWDEDTSGQTDTNDGDDDSGTGKTTSEMQSVATYTDTSTTGLSNPWDFLGNPNEDTSSNEIWDIDSGYPFFASVEWDINYSWSSSVYSSDALWSKVLNWSGSINASSASWNKIESWTNNVDSPLYWTNLEGWSGVVSSPVGWFSEESWSGSVSASVSWSNVNSWSGLVRSPISGENVELNAGWNLFSLPVNPENAEVRAVFDNLGYSPDVVGWTNQYDIVEEGGNLEVGEGYWVYLKEQEIIHVRGTQVKDFNLELNEGWNISGLPRDISPIAVSDVFDSLSYVPDVVGWTNQYDIVEEGGNLEVGEGYWMYLRDSENINLSA